MKNKGLIYALLIVVAFVWYKVFVRVASNLTAENTELLQPTNPKTSFQSIDRESFELIASYRDPFTGSASKPQIIPDQIPNSNPKPEVKIVKKSTVDWPVIQYKGQVRKTNSNDPLSIIYIDGNQLHLRKGESIYDGILIKSVHRDSVVIVYKKHRRSYGRE